jgi:hypothetical protein
VHDAVGEAIAEALLPVLRRLGALLPAEDTRPAGPVGPVGRGESSPLIGNGASPAS